MQLNSPENYENDPYKYTEFSSANSLLTKYDLPITHLDFSYVEKCNNAKELEKILHVLRSGQEGYYPDLMRAVEEKLQTLNPKSKLLRTVSRVKEKADLNSDEWEEITDDLSSWIREISRDNKELELRKGSKHPEHFTTEIRKGKEIVNEPPKTVGNVKRIRSTDYASWDKYDPDTEILKMDLEDEKLKTVTSANKNAKQTQKVKKHVKFNMFSTEAEANFQATKEREKGNEYFRSNEYDSAIFHYSNSLECKTTIETLRNRAMVYIKLAKHEEALSDCEAAIAINPNDFKANYRKAVALEHLGKFEKSLETVENCLRIDPHNSAVQQLAERVRKRCKNKLKSKRFTIEETSKSSSDDESETDDSVLIPIPGTSKTPGPHFVISNVENYNETVQQINARSCTTVGNLITLSNEEDDAECLIDHFETVKLDQLDSRCSNARVKRNSTTAPLPLPSPRIEDEKAGGEPHNVEDPISIPEDIHSPFTFLKTWNSIGSDPTFKKHAHLIKNLNLNRLVQVIGCKMDNTMFSKILGTLCMHFTVPGEVERIYDVIVNLARLPRFSIISMLMSDQDENYLKILIGFLQQHDRSLPEDVAKVYRKINVET